MTNQATTANGNGQPKTALAKRPKSSGELLRDEFEKWRPTLRAVLPSHLDPDRIIKMACMAFVRSEDLQRCTLASVVKATIMAAELGLEVGGLLGEAYLVPYDNKKKVKDGNQWKEVKVREATLIPGYKGLAKLARQSGDVSAIYACVVDTSEVKSFAVTLGTERGIKHEMNLCDSRKGEVFAVYAVVKFKDGSDHFEVMTRSQVDAIRKRSKATGDTSPWATDYEWMAKKTALKQALKLVTLSPDKPQLAMAIAADNAVESGEAFNTDITAEFEALDEGATAEQALSQGMQQAPVQQETSRAAELGALLDGKKAASTPHDPTTGEVKS